jgi:Ca2+-binding RTX toxin-like protein
MTGETVHGGAGDDVYVLATATSVVVEHAGGGTDLVQAAVSHTLAAHTENLLLTGIANLSGTGNGLANVLTGNTGANTLQGGDGHDRLDGGAGADRLEGGAGNDTYVLAVAGDVLVELAGGGTDIVHAGFSHTLGAQVENLILTGTSTLTGTGNGLANALIGNGVANTLRGLEGHDRLEGRAGVDRLEGGLGNDAFQFAYLAEAGDVVADFASLSGNNDFFRISAAGFGGGLVAGAFLATTQFRIRADNLAQDGDDRFIFRTSDTTLWFDSNGNGTGGLTMVADLQAGATVAAADILLF